MDEHEGVDVGIGARRWSVGLAWSTAGIALALTAIGLALQVVTFSTPVPLDFASRDASALVALLFVTLPVLGALIVRRQPHAPLAWAFIAIGTTMAIWVLADGYAVYALLTRPGALPAGGLFAWLANWIWIVGWTVTGLMFLVFPDGRLPSHRWRPFAWAFLCAGTAFAVATMTVDGRLANYTFVDNPLGVLPLDPPSLKLAGSLVLLALGLGAMASLVAQTRRATGERRLQYQWVCYAGALVVVVLALGWSLFALGYRNPLTENLAQVVPVALPIAAAVAVLKHRLFDIELVVNKTLVFGPLAGLVTLVYVVVVVGLGSVIGRGEEPDLVLSIAATAVAAMAFEPARRRAQELADRVVYGRRASPYEVLRQFSRRMGEQPGTRELLTQMAQLVGEATGAARTEVWLRFDEELRASACWPEGACAEGTVVLEDDQAHLLASYDLAIPVHHHGELLGVLAVRTGAGETIRPLEVALVSDLAAQAGHVLRNVRLTEELVGRLGDLRASRERLVSAQDEERRRLERDLHDGAQQYLVALRVQLGLARQILDDEPEEMRSLLAEMEELAGEAIDSLRTLARGDYPPVLADHGLVAAVRAHVDRSHLPVEVEGDGVVRYARDIEAALYFCCLEALQNATKHGQASKISVRFVDGDGALVLVVEDDGHGFEPGAAGRGAGMRNMSDRLEVLGGSLEVRSRPGHGTQVSGRVPVTGA